MAYCTECGLNHHAEENDSEGLTIVEAPEVTANEVRIAEINAAKEIKLAQIAAGTFKEEILLEAAVDTAHAEGEAQGLREAISPPETEEPTLIAPVQVNEEPEPESLEVPEPVTEHHEPSRKSQGFGAW